MFVCVRGVGGGGGMCGQVCLHVQIHVCVHYDLHIPRCAMEWEAAVFAFNEGATEVLSIMLMFPISHCSSWPRKTSAEWARLMLSSLQSCEHRTAYAAQRGHIARDEERRDGQVYGAGEHWHWCEALTVTVYSLLCRCVAYRSGTVECQNSNRTLYAWAWCHVQLKHDAPLCNHTWTW